MAEEVEVRLSFWPGGLIGGSGVLRIAGTSAKELADLCSSKDSGCPMGCFSCPFDRKCADITESDWSALFSKPKDAKEDSNGN